jgi:hypothetical protein
MRINKDEFVEGIRYIPWCSECESEIIYDDNLSPEQGSCRCGCAYPARDWTMRRED